jgi:hypothetical protein
MDVQRFRTVPQERPNGGIRVALTFDPTATWGARDAFHVHGKIHGHPFRGALKAGDRWVLELGPSWCRFPGFAQGEEVIVEMALEGPQTTTMGADVAEAFQMEPEAARFFDSMPTFYRKNVARAIAAAKLPETRAKRISDAVSRAKRRQRDT